VAVMTGAFIRRSFCFHYRCDL